MGRGNFGGDRIADLSCELRHGDQVMGPATDRRFIPDGDHVKRTITLNGGAQIPEGGGEVSLWCLTQLGDVVDNGQMLFLKVGSFS